MSMSSRRPRRARRLAALVVVTGLVVSACGGDDDDDAASSEPAASVPAETDAPAAPATTAASGEPATTAAADTTVAAEPTPTEPTEPTATTAAPEDGLECPGPAEGDAVKVGVVWPEGPAINLPDLGEAAQATADYANECLGGIGGRPIEVVGCTIDETNPAGATDCGGQFVEAGVSAVVVTITSQGATLVPIVTGAGIPYIVSGGTSPAESIDSTGLVFSVAAGVAASLGAMASRAQEEGISKVSLLVSENAAAGVQGLAGIPFGSAGVEVEVVPIPAGTADMTPQLSAALSGGAGATAIVGDATLCIGYLQAAAAVDPDGEHWIIVTCVGDEVVEAVGEEALDGAVLMGGADPDSDEPQAVIFDEVMAQYSPDTELTGFTGAGYQAMISLIRGTAGIEGEADAAGIAAAMKRDIDVVSAIGYGSTFNCSKPHLPPLTVCSGDTIVSVMDGGTPVDSELFDAAAVFGG